MAIRVPPFSKTISFFFMLVSFQQFKSNDKLCNINISKIVEFIGSVKNGNYVSYFLPINNISSDA